MRCRPKGLSRNWNVNAGSLRLIQINVTASIDRSLMPKRSSWSTTSLAKIENIYNQLSRGLRGVGPSMAKCHGSICGLIESSSRSEKQYQHDNAVKTHLTNVLFCQAPWMVPTVFMLMGKNKSAPAKGPKKSSTENHLYLNPGDWVQIKTEEEIRSTLDKDNKTKGLRFMPEMAKFCGGKFRVFKRVERITLEATGEMRSIRTPTYFLEGVFCDGEFSGGCQRSCFLFWKEDWLKPVIQ